MAHEIAMIDHKPALAYSDRQTPWHKLGTAWAHDYDMTVHEAFATTGIDQVKVEKHRYHVDLPDGSKLESDDYALLRAPVPGDDQYKMLGVVSEGYEPLDNMFIASVLDGLGKHCKLDVVGSLRNHTVLFCTFLAGELAIMVNGKPDEVKLYLLFREYKSVGSAASFLISGVRSVCMNTINRAEKEAQLKIELGHNQGVANNLKWTTDTLSGIASKQEAMRNAMQMLADKKIGTKGVEQVINATFPEPEMPQRLQLARSEDSRFPKEAVELDEKRWNTQRDLMAAYRQKSHETYETVTVSEGADGTAWGIYNAIVDVCDHQQVGLRRMSAESRALSAFDGSRYNMKIRAWDAAMVAPIES